MAPTSVSGIGMQSGTNGMHPCPFHYKSRNFRRFSGCRFSEIRCHTGTYASPGKSSCRSASNSTMAAELDRLKERRRVFSLMGMRIACS